MKTLNLIQGSADWLYARSQHFTASEAPAMMGASKYQSRDDLLKLKATGIAHEVSPAQQRLFDKGHATEASIRPFIESIIGEELFPVTGSIEFEGLKLLASFDGLTMMGDKGFEHKLWNHELAVRVQMQDLEPHYYWQLEQQLLVSGADSILFVTSNGTPEQCAHFEYVSIPERRAALIAGLHQLKNDLENYVAPEAEAPKAIAIPVDSLPSINYKIDFTKGITIHSNLDAFKVAAQQLVENSTALLVTDQDFENAKARIKECEHAEANIKSLIDRMLGDLGDADTFKRDLESIGGWIRQSRLNQDKQVKNRSAERKAEIINAGKVSVNEHVALINANLSPVHLPNIPVDFDAAVFRKSSFANMQSGVNDAVAAFKIEANRIASKIESNLELLRMIAADHMNLFADLQQVCLMDSEPLRAIALRRIEDAKAAEQARIQAEAKRIANEQIERDRFNKEQMEKRAAAEAQNSATEKQEVQLDFVGQIPAEYDEYASTAPAFEKSFNDVFSDAPDPAPMVDLGDFHTGYAQGEKAGIIKGLDLALAIFIKQGAAGFAKAVKDFIEVSE